MKIFWASLLLMISLSCSSLSRVPEQSLLDQAKEELQDWRKQGQVAVKPAQGEAFEKAQSALEKLEFLQEKENSAQAEIVSFHLIEAQLATAAWSGAFYQTRKHLEAFPLSEKRPELEKWLYQIGVHWAQQEDGWWDDLFSSSESRALQAFRYLVENAPRSPFADDALRWIAEIYFRNREFEDAIAHYDRILQGYPESVWGDLSQFRAGLCYLEKVTDPRCDRDSLTQAQKRLDEYLEKRKEGAFLKQAQQAHALVLEKLAQSEFAIGEFYERIERPEAARSYFENIVQKFPSTQYSRTAQNKLNGSKATVSTQP